MQSAPTEHYHLSLHDALPISQGVEQLLRRLLAHRAGVDEDEVRVRGGLRPLVAVGQQQARDLLRVVHVQDRKSTRLNSSHTVISYAVFCLKKKKEKNSISEIV